MFTQDFNVFFKTSLKNCGVIEGLRSALPARACMVSTGTSEVDLQHGMLVAAITAMQKQFSENLASPLLNNLTF
jgi:hypothetical protein